MRKGPPQLMVPIQIPPKNLTEKNLLSRNQIYVGNSWNMDHAPMKINANLLMGLMN